MNPFNYFAGCIVAASTLAGPGDQHSARAAFRFRILHAGKQLGTAAYERTTSNGERHTILTIDESENGATLTAVIDSTSKRDGTQEKKSFHGVLAGHPFSAAAVFSSSIVEFTYSRNADPPQVAKVPIPANSVLTDTSETWFDTTTPKPGDKAVFTNFNVQTGGWEQTTTTFVGDEDTAIGAKTYKTHHVHVKSDQGEIDMYLDDNADIVVMDQLGSQRMERAE